jgi:plasmid stability protein
MKISRNVAIFVLGSLVALGALVAIRALREGPSDEDQIRALFEQAAKAVEEKRPGDAMAAVSERFQGEGMGHRELKQFITYQALRGSWNAVLPVAAKVKVTGDRAEAVVDAALVRGGKGEGIVARLPEAGDTWRIDASLERENDGWKVVSARWRRITAAEGLTGSPP